MSVVDESVAVIKSLKPDFTPKMGFILGSGQGKLVDLVEDPTHISYDDLPGFPHITVKGHAPYLTLGTINSVPIVLLRGRCHPYEKLDYAPVKNYVRTIQRLGADLVFLTNASGSLRVDIEPGELMMITDHINLMPGNPLAGVNDEEFGSRFFSMDQAYDSRACKALRRSAKNRSINLKEGVYISVLGPNFETAAEIKAFRMLGADAVGMSTVPEVLVARHCGLKVVAVATITNYGTGLGDSQHMHDSVLEVANNSVHNLNELVVEFVGQFKNAD